MSKNKKANENVKDTVTCSTVLDRDMYNNFKSICYREGKSVKECIVQYMKSVIDNDNQLGSTSSTKDSK